MIFIAYFISEKKRLIDSRTVSIDYEGWVEFNVINSLNFWLHHSNKNFGLVVEVEDAFGQKLNPNLYFQNINCSGEIRKSPILHLLNDKLFFKIKSCSTCDHLNFLKKLGKLTLLM